MRRPQNLKKSPTCFDKTAVFCSVASKQGGDFLKFLWPSQKSWALTCMFTKTKNSELVTRQSKILLTRTEYKRRNALIFLSLHFALSQSLFCLFVSSSCLKFKSKIIVFWCILLPVKWIGSAIFFSLFISYLGTYVHI